MATTVKIEHDDFIRFLTDIGVWGHLDEWEIYDFYRREWAPVDFNFSSPFWWCELPFPYLNGRTLADVVMEHAERLEATVYYTEATHVFAALRPKSSV